MTHALRSYRQKNGIRLHHLAGSLGISAGTLSRIENGKQEPSASLLRRIAEETAGVVSPNDMLAVVIAESERTV